MTALIEDYCREAGVRNLQKHLEKIYRKVALKLAKSKGPDAAKQVGEARAKVAAAQKAGAQRRSPFASPLTLQSSSVSFLSFISHR